MEAKFVCNLKKYRVAQELTQEQRLRKAVYLETDIMLWKL